MTADLVVEARLLDGREARIAVAGGVVEGLHGPAWPPPPGARLYRPPAPLIAPAFLDIHVHLRGLELSYKEDERTGTLAALAGGVAGVVDMPNTRPELRSPLELGAKLEALKSRALADYAVWAGVPRRPGDAGAMACTPGVAGFKVYPQDLAGEAAVEAARAAARAGGVVVVHPEHPGMVGEDCPLGERGSRCRPPEAEAAGARLAVERLGWARLHLTHATTPATVAAAASSGATVDVAPHHLVFTSRDEARGCAYKVNPPLRPPGAAEALRRLLAAGAVDAVASDHAPHAPWEKSRGHPECPPGIPGVEYASRALLTLASRGLLPLEAVWRLYSRAPALILGMPGWGCLRPGCRAALVAVDPGREGVVGRDTRDYSRAGPGAWEGFRYRGEPVALILGGEVVMEEGEVYEDAARRARRPLPLRRTCASASPG